MYWCFNVVMIKTIKMLRKHWKFAEEIRAGAVWGIGNDRNQNDRNQF